MTVRRLLAYALTAITVAAGSIMLGANPASASLPRCDGIVQIWDFTYRQDATLWYGTAPGSNINCENSINDQSLKLISVIVLQESLNNCYGPQGQYAQLFSPVLAVDGSYGPKTTAAVRALQSYLTVGVDGRAGPQTRSHMALYDEQNQQCTMAATPIQIR